MKLVNSNKGDLDLKILMVRFENNGKMLNWQQKKPPKLDKFIKNRGNNKIYLVIQINIKP